MKKQLSVAQLVLTVTLFITLTSCNPTVTGEGPVVDVKKDADKFSKVDLQMEGDVIVKQGADNSIIVHAQKNIADAIQVTISGKTVRIYSDKNLEPTEPVEITVTMNNIEGLELSGSGVIRSEGTIKSTELDLKVSGSGKFFVDAVSNNIKGKISGSGVMNLKGSATESDLEISGSGSLFAYGLLTQNVSATISGSGSAEVTATSQLNAKISGSGNITYKGNPAKVNPKITGSGTINPSN